MAERKVTVFTGADGKDYDVRDEEAQQSIITMGNKIGSVPSGKTLQGQIETLSNGIGSVPSGQTVEGQISALESGKVPTTRKVNNKALSSDITLVGTDIPVSSSDSTKVDSALASKVPNTRKVNSKALSSDVNLVGSDIPVSALDNTKLDTAIGDLKSAINEIRTYVKSKNLYDPDDQNVLQNTYMNTNGTTEEYTGRLVTGFMPVVPGKKVVMSRFNGASQELSSYSSCCFFKADKTTVVTGGTYNQNGTTVPNNAAYVRCTVASSYIKIQIELADSVAFTPYEAYYTPIPKIQNNVIVPPDCVEGLNDDLAEIDSKFNTIGNIFAPNVLNMDAIKSGYITKDGTIVNETPSTLFYTDFIPVSKGDVIRVSKLDTTSEVSMRFITAYDSSKAAKEESGETSKSTYIVPDGISYIRATLSTAYNPNQMILKNYVASRYIEYGEEVFEKNIFGYLPKDIYIVTNRDYEIYDKQICPFLGNYIVKWSDGIKMNDRVRIKKTSAGTSTLSCNVYDEEGNIVMSLSVTVHAVAQTSSSVSLIPFGDSLTNHCKWEAELENVNPHISCVGSRSRTVEDSDNEERTIYDEGRAGFTSYDYTGGTAYTGGSDSGGDESPHNRWYDPSAEKFSMSYYMANNFPSGQTTPNCMTFFLGMNDLMSVYHSVSDIANNIKSMIDEIRTYSDTLKIVIISPQLRYQKIADSLEQAKFADFAKALENVAKDYSNVCYLPMMIGMDCVNNYPMTEVTINTRNPATEMRCADITHPSAYGYWQMADWIDGAISYLFS